jgi:hypothetical protein
MAGHTLTLKMYRRAGTASLEKSNILRINMLKNFLLMLAMCSFAQVDIIATIESYGIT